MTKAAGAALSVGQYFFDTMWVRPLEIGSEYRSTQRTLQY